MSRRNDEKWLNQFEIYKSYVENFHKFPPLNAVFEGLNLGYWFHNQITAFRNGLMLEYRQQMMDEFSPNWKESRAVKLEIKKDDKKRRILDSDIPIDTVLSGEDLDACVSHGIYGCRQYLECFEKYHGRKIWEKEPHSLVVSLLGAEGFSLDSRRKVFEAVFPKVSFGCFNFIYAACSFHAAFDELGFERNEGISYLEAANIYNVRSRFSSSAEMLDCFNVVLEKFKLKESEVVLGKYHFGMTSDELQERLSVTRGRIWQLERAAFEKLLHPAKVRDFRLFSYEELLKIGRVCDVPDGFVFHGDLDLAGSQINSLPKGLHIEGYLNLLGTEISELPAGLIVEGNLYLSDGIKEVPDFVNVGGRVYQPYSETVELIDAYIDIEKFGFSMDTNCTLKDNGIHTKMDLLDLSEQDLFSLRGMSQEAAEHIVCRLKRLGYSLREEIIIDGLIEDATNRAGGNIVGIGFEEIYKEI